MKKVSFLLIVVFLCAAFIGCSSNSENNVELEWTITVEGIGDSAVEFTNIDAAELNTKAVEAVLRKKDGSEVTQNWEGVPLKAVLESLGAQDYQSVIIEAGDGYSQEYSLDLINRAETILGFKVDGNMLGDEDGPVQAVPTGEPGNMWIKNVAKLIVQ